MTLISPSILSADFCNLRAEIGALEDAGADMIHIDVMDGHFVPNLTFGPAVIKSLKKHSSIPFDVHLMIEQPEKWIQTYVEAGADIITIHPEATIHLDRTISEIKSYRGIKSGISLLPTTPLNTIEFIIDKIDLILVMTVNPGFGGQKFMSNQLKKIESISSIIKGTNIILAVDGGINNETGELCTQAGANMLISGNYIFSGDYKERINSLKKWNIMFETTSKEKADLPNLTIISQLPNGFVYLKQICPTIVEDIKYATNDNFTGTVVPGYEASVAILTKEAALALNLIQQELESQNLSLLIWDAYRPTQAVDFFLSWEKIPDNQEIKIKYYPEYEKHELFKIGFIAPGHSSHSRGSTVDLTIIDTKTNKALDMGTDFDFFGKKSYTTNLQISKHAKQNRLFLKNLMETHGFIGIIQEWWHYTLKIEPFDKYFNFPVK